MKKIKHFDPSESLYEKSVTSYAKHDEELTDIYFNTNKAEFDDSNIDKIQPLIDILNLYPEAKLTLVGHSDNTGSSLYNMQLSNKRAQTVENAFTKAGIDVSRITVVAKGEEEPASTTVRFKENLRIGEFKLGYLNFDTIGRKVPRYMRGT